MVDRSHKDNERVKELCLALLRADSEDEVVRLLTEAGFWEAPTGWRLYGDNPNNRGTAGAQQAHSDAAIVEKLVNSIDATLMSEAFVRGIDPMGPEAPTTIQEGVIRFFDEGFRENSKIGGRFSTWPTLKITEIARRITICATGAAATKGDPCFTIADAGEGQTPEMFPHTLLTLSESNKKQIGFVQGAFSMGGTGVLRFCGRRKLQFVLSRRNPRVLDKERVFSSDTMWGFTIVRRNSSRDRAAVFYEYLAPIVSEANDGTMGVLRFTAENLPIFPEKNEAYVRASEWGTVVKLYEYSCVGFGKSSVHLKDGLTARLQLRLPKPALPIRCYECRREYRGIKERSYEYNVTGIAHRIEESRKKEENLEAKIFFPMRVEGEDIDVTVYVFRKSRHVSFKKNEGVLFVYNGQTQGHLTHAFFASEKIGLSYLKESLLVLVDCSKLGAISQDELFMTNRFTLAKSKFTEALKAALVEQLRDNQELRRLKNKRREEQLVSKLEDQRPFETVLKDILKKNRSLAAFFAIGERLSNPFNVKQVGTVDEPFVGKRFPEYFKFKGRESGYLLEKNCHVNLRFQLIFETDAEDEYFSREIERGQLDLFLVNAEGRSVVANKAGPVLKNGIATMRVSLPEGCKIGDTFTYCAVLMDDSRVEPIENTVRVTVTHSVLVRPGGSGVRKPPGRKAGKEREQATGLTFPHMTDVRRSEWEEHTPPFDERTALRIKSAGDCEGSDGKVVYDFFINVDNLYLQTEAKVSKSDPRVLTARFRFGMVLLGLGIIQSHHRNDLKKVGGGDTRDSGNDGDDLESRVDEFGKAVAPVLLPMIDGLGGLDDNALKAFDEPGEEI